MSKHSPGTVEDSEILARFVFSPIQVDKKGKVKPNSFSHIQSYGCSIQRDSIAEERELLELVKQVSGSKDDLAWKGVIAGQCRDIRDILIDETHRRAICVYDTANPDNPAHGELCQSEHMDEADSVELRHNLFIAFGSGNIISPLHYRNGKIWERLPQDLQARA